MFFVFVEIFFSTKNYFLELVGAGWSCKFSVLKGIFFITVDVLFSTENYLKWFGEKGRESIFLLLTSFFKKIGAREKPQGTWSDKDAP